jgi:hypothetical protein
MLAARSGAPRGYSAETIAARMKKIHDRRADAQSALDAHRDLEAKRLRELLECADEDVVDPRTFAPLRWENSAAATVEVATAPLEAREVVPYVKRGRHVVPVQPGVNDDRSCQDAAIRAQLVGTEQLEKYEEKHGENGRRLYAELGFVSRRGDEEIGRVEGWGVLLEQARQVQQVILRGTLGAIQRQCPDLATAERWRQAGVTVVHDLARPWGAFERYGSSGNPHAGLALRFRSAPRLPRAAEPIARPGSVAWFTM